MLDIIYIITIFIVESISIQISGGILIMPYLLYLTNFKAEKSLVLVGITALIYSLQTDRFFEILAYFILFYIVFYNINKHLEYTYINILIFSVAQQILWWCAFEKGVYYIGIIIPFVFYNILNYLFIKIYKKTRAGAVQQWKWKI